MDNNKAKTNGDCKNSFLDEYPSKVTHKPWIWARRQTNDYPNNTINGGKWLIFVDKNIIDEIWMKVKRETENGALGNISKVATNRQNPNQTSVHKKVICVYTYDCNDEQDVKRIRQNLRKMGITDKIPYKTNKATKAGKYRVKGYSRISLYFE